MHELSPNLEDLLSVSFSRAFRNPSISSPTTRVLEWRSHHGNSPEKQPRHYNIYLGHVSEDLGGTVRWAPSIFEASCKIAPLLGVYTLRIAYTPLRRLGGGEGSMIPAFSD